MPSLKASTVVLLVATGVLVGACGKSGGSKSKTSPPAAKPAAVLPAADCSVIKPIAGQAVTTLAPLQSESKSAQATALGNYVAQLKGAEAKVTSATGKADLNALINALQGATSASAASQVTAAIGKLSADCP